jgi:hypothetical protein
MVLLIDGSDLQIDRLAVSHEMKIDDGEHTLELKAYDLAGHVTTLMHIFRVDSRAPSITIDRERTMVNMGVLELYFKIGDDDSEIHPLQVKVDDGEFEILQTNRVFTSEKLDMGEHVVTIRVADEVGNVHDEEYHFEVNEDNSLIAGSESTTSSLMVIIIIAALVLASTSALTGFLIKRKGSKNRKGADEKGPAAPSRPPNRISLPAPIEAPKDERCLPPAKGYVETVQGVNYHRPDRK